MEEYNEQQDHSQYPQYHFLHLLTVPAAILGALLFLAILYWFFFAYQMDGEDGVVCAQDAMLCPDGSYVGRIPPNCEFAECPSEESRTMNQELGRDVERVDPELVERWQTYRNEEYGFELKYPSNVALNEGEVRGGIKLIFGEMEERAGSVEISVQPTEKTKLSEYSFLNSERATLGPYEAIRLLNDTPSFAWEGYILLWDGKEYSLSVVPSNEELMQQILSTFQFVE